MSSLIPYREQALLFAPEYPNYAGQKVCLGLSGGINSAAMLIWLAQAPQHMKPAEMHLVYHHFAEHSPDTKPFVWALEQYAQQRFPKVIYIETDNSMLAFCEENKMIPHPSVSPCTRIMKTVPMLAYMVRNGITQNPVGYVKGEAARRAGNMAKKAGGLEAGGAKQHFPIAAYDDEWCFHLVKSELGWYPAIYDLRWDDPGLPAFWEGRIHDLSPQGQRKVAKMLRTRERVFGHNNCLPCKNHELWQLLCIEYFYPDYMARARQTQAIVGRHWGRDEQGYYAQFGYHEKDPNSGTPCGICAL